jgi:hypothetical protein
MKKKSAYVLLVTIAIALCLFVSAAAPSSPLCKILGGENCDTPTPGTTAPPVSTTTVPTIPPEDTPTSPPEFTASPAPSLTPFPTDTPFVLTYTPGLTITATDWLTPTATTTQKAPPGSPPEEGQPSPTITGTLTLPVTGGEDMSAAAAEAWFRKATVVVSFLVGLLFLIWVAKWKLRHS